MYRIRYIGDPILRKKCENILEFDDQLQRIVDEMIQVMHKEDGIGLAAPQVGLDKNILVLDISSIEKQEEPRAFINPVISDGKGESVIEEGCLSIPGVREDVNRPAAVSLTYQDTRGNEHNEWFDGWLARVLQHEIDHLNGILFVDRISPVKRQMLINSGSIPEVY